MKCDNVANFWEENPEGGQNEAIVFQFNPNCLEIFMNATPPSKLNRVKRGNICVYHLISCLPRDLRYSFALEKGLLPKKPRYDDKGEGCGEAIILFFPVFTALPFS